MAHRRTIDVYETAADHYAQRRGVQQPEWVERFATAVAPGRVRLDLGCGPGHYLPLIGRPAVAADAARAMVDRARRDHPDVPAVQADLGRLPFGRGSLGGVWSSKAHQHLPAAELPAALADLRHAMAVDAPLALTVFTADPFPDGDPVEQPAVESVSDRGDDLPGRLFTRWRTDRLVEVLEAAAFAVDDVRVEPGDSADFAQVRIDARAVLGLPDHVGPDLALVCCGLNPSIHAAEAGVGYVTPSNRFWPALAEAGLVDRDRLRDPRHLLRAHAIGMTDLVKRPTTRADELRRDEYAAGLVRLERLCRWLQPRALAVVGLAGWRAAVDRRATPGWQPEPLGPTPVYVLGSTSGLNAHTSVGKVADHLRAALAGPPS